MSNLKKLKLKKTLVPTLMTGAVFLSTLGLMNTNASAEINKDNYLADHECTIVIDKANNIVKTNKQQKATGVCSKRVSGMYFKKGKREFYSLNGWSIDYINYSGEPFYFGFSSGDAIAKVFLTDSKQNIKGKTMHVAPTKLSVYKTPIKSSKKLTTVKRYKTVVVKDVKGSWAKVKANGKTGWVSRNSLVNEVTITEVKKVVTKYKSYTRVDPTYEPGRKELINKGENGLKYLYYKTKYKNGKLVSKKKKIWTDVVTYPQDEFYFIGE
ncbi:G5 domain-containing protein [Rummeliibacillus stabekisii]|uniref:G5 domain-containing protein n=1 Tax=Rummeliibacillus stabekisii TaxID=241244 RepID=UPI00203C304D|nr:G5 domain-containing protein [Rummeliibacillus stabekisii]MCM3317976.1 G5 domain-containing protein [Rummeliibacillus stabekisii]